MQSSNLICLGAEVHAASRHHSWLVTQPPRLRGAGCLSITFLPEDSKRFKTRDKLHPLWRRPEPCGRRGHTPEAAVDSSKCALRTESECTHGPVHMHTHMFTQHTSTPQTTHIMMPTELVWNSCSPTCQIALLFRPLPAVFLSRSL